MIRRFFIIHFVRILGNRIEKYFRMTIKLILIFLTIVYQIKSIKSMGIIFSLFIRRTLYKKIPPLLYSVCIIILHTYSTHVSSSNIPKKSLLRPRHLESIRIFEICLISLCPVTVVMMWNNVIFGQKLRLKQP